MSRSYVNRGVTKRENNLETVAQTEIDYVSAVAIYKEALLQAKEAGFGKKDAKMFAREALFKVHPELRMTGGVGEKGAKFPRLYSLLGKVVNDAFGRAKPRLVHRSPKPVQGQIWTVADATKMKSFKDMLLECAKAGFIPFQSYLAPFVGDSLASNLAARIRKEIMPFYDVQPGLYGYVCAPLETPEQKEMRLMRERIEAMEAELQSYKRKLK